jgi:predicted ATP-grasp superfamily ATP-dependent carboligase
MSSRSTNRSRRWTLRCLSRNSFPAATRSSWSSARTSAWTAFGSLLHSTQGSSGSAGVGHGYRGASLPVPDIVEPSIALLQSLAFAGVSEIEYKRDPRSGRYALIEINPRHWDQHTLGVASGVNLTHAMYADLTGASVPLMEQNRRPACWIAEEGYLIGLRDVLLGRGYPLRQYLSPLRYPKSWATFSLRDLRPFLRLLRRVAGDYARCLRGLFRRRRRAELQ